MIKYSICILTFKREKLLSKLLYSIIIQEKISLDEIEVLIIDNDSNPSNLEKLVENFDAKILIRYFLQPIKNLSISRNLAISKSSGLYTIFIDDDEYADPFWLYTLTRCIEDNNADVVFGNLINYFDGNVPEYLKDDNYYYPKLGQTGQAARFYYTGNCIIRLEILKNTKILFDENFGISGGEDVIFFERLKKKGYKLIFCEEAKIFELVDAKRGTLKYLFKRHFRYGNIYIKRKFYTENKKSIRINLFIKSLIKLIYFSLLLILSILNRKKLVTYALKLSSAFGELLYFLRYQINMYE